MLFTYGMEENCKEILVNFYNINTDENIWILIMLKKLKKYLFLFLFIQNI